MPITSILDLRLKPEAVATAPAELHAILTDTRAFEGCLGVDVLIDAADPTHVTLIERWASEERDQAYRAWRAADGASNLGDLLSAAPILTKYTLAADI